MFLQYFRGLPEHESTSLRFHTYYNLVIIYESLFVGKRRKSCEELKWGRQYHKRGENMGLLKFKNLMYYTNDTLHVQSHCNFRVYDMTSRFVKGVYVRGTCGIIISTKNNIVHNHPMTWNKIFLFHVMCFIESFSYKNFFFVFPFFFANFLYFHFLHSLLYYLPLLDSSRGQSLF